MRITVLLLDLDDTLVVEEPAALEALGAAARHAADRCGVDPLAYRDMVKRHARELWHAMPVHPTAKRIGISSWEALWANPVHLADSLGLDREAYRSYQEESWGGPLRELGIHDSGLPAALSECYHRERRLRHRAFPEVYDMLALLSRQFRLCLVTNGIPGLQREKIEGARIGGWFRHVIISGDVGRGKPDPAIFAAALAAFGAAPDESCMVGNSLDTDIAGALRAGIGGIWLNRDGTPAPEGIVPHAVISSLRDVAGAIRSIERL